MKTGMSIRSLTILWIQWDMSICSVRMFVVLLRIIKMFLFLMFSRKHCLMSIKGCLRRQLIRHFTKLRILRVEVLSSGMKFLMTIFSLVWKSVILMVKKNGMKSFAF